MRRREPMQLAAEMLRAQLPPLTYSTGHQISVHYDFGEDAS